MKLIVLAADVPEEVLKQRSSILQYGLLQWTGPFEQLGLATLRIGKKLYEENYRALADCSIANPDFEVEDLVGWKNTGLVEVSNDDSGVGPGYFAKIRGRGAIEQEIEMKPGNYKLRVKARANGTKAVIGIRTKDAGRIETEVAKGPLWRNYSLLFTVPAGQSKVTVYASVKGPADKGVFLVDDILVVRNTVAKEFPGQSIPSGSGQ